MVFTLLLLPAIGFAQPNAYDTAYIFDQRQGGRGKWGWEPLLLRFANGDSLWLDASTKGSEFVDVEWQGGLVNAGARVEGVRVLFSKGSTLCVQATGWDTAGLRLRLDTLLCLNGNTPKPWIYWNPVRKAKMGLFTRFTRLTLSNHEWALGNFYRHWRAVKVLWNVRYQYNTATGILVDYKMARKKG